MSLARSQGLNFCLLIVSPQAQHFYRLFIIHHLVNQPVSYVDPPGMGPCQISHQLFIMGRGLVWVILNDSKQFFRFFLEAGS